MNQQTVLITGGAGYIGSQTAYHLIDEGHKVIIFDNFSNSSETVLKELPQSCEIITGDLKNKDQLRKLFATHPEIDSVVHCAASIAVGESVVDPSLYYNNNVVSTINLLDTMVEYHVTSLVFSSTAATYGTPKTIPITESAPQKPINPYGNSKLAMEWMISDYVQAYDLQAVVFRYFNACGADLQARTGYLKKPATHLIPIIINVIAGKSPELKIYGDDYDTPDGTCIRDYVHVLDIANAHRKGLEYLSKDTEKKIIMCNLGTDTGYSVNEIVAEVERISGKQVPQKIVERRAGDPDRLIADNSLARTLLNWKPKYSDLNTIIKGEIAWREKVNQRKIS